MADIGPVSTEQLKRQGVDASFSLPPDFYDRFQKGDYTRRPLRSWRERQRSLLHASSLPDVTRAVPGGHQVNFSKWKNEEYDKIVDEVAVTDIEDKAKLDRALPARRWRSGCPDLPDIPLVQNWYHRIPMNTTYWTGWPTEQNPYVNGAFWHLTYG